MKVGVRRTGRLTSNKRPKEGNVAVDRIRKEYVNGIKIYNFTWTTFLPSMAAVTSPSPPSSSPTFTHISSKTQFSDSTLLRCRFRCSCRLSSSFSSGDDSLLHDSLSAAGVDTRHARVSREGFFSEISRLTEATRDASVTTIVDTNLAKTALHIAAEDDSLVSHSSVDLPVDAFMERLGVLSLGFRDMYMTTQTDASNKMSSSLCLDYLEEYLFLHKGFRVKVNQAESDARSLYLHSVLTCRYGSSVMLSVIYSEIFKMLKVQGFLDFNMDICVPRDNSSLPRGHLKKNTPFPNRPSILTNHLLLSEILTNLKYAFWPFKYDHTSSLFLRAANAARLGGYNFSFETSSSSFDHASFELASTKAAQHRLERGVWTNIRYGDMRRALAACERLIFLLDNDPDELRDYAVLLYHCGYYKESLLYLDRYQTAKMKSPQPQTVVEELEEEGVEKLVARLNLICMEDGWKIPGGGRNFWCQNSEPW